jgi:hypothetical protein
MNTVEMGLNEGGITANIYVHPDHTRYGLEAEDLPIEWGVAVAKMLATVADDSTTFELPWRGGGMLTPAEALEQLTAEYPAEGKYPAEATGLKAVEGMTDERADGILVQYDVPELLESVLMSGDRPGNPNYDNRIELADALAFTWRRDSDAPGFNQPSGEWVREVEDIIGEPVWPLEATG